MIDVSLTRPMKPLAHLALALATCLFFALACSSGQPVKPTPTTCQSDVDCTQGHCDPKSGCVACVFDAHCSAGERCSGGSCYTPTACAVDDDCSVAGFPVCDPGTRECVRCLADSQCGDSAHCRAGRCEPFAKCAAEKDCKNGSHCDLGSGECVSCLTQGDCQLGNDCVKGECRLSCKAEADCAGSGGHCTGAGYCGECATDAHCPGVYHCEAGSCVRDVCEQSTTRCAKDGESVGTCSANGDGVAMSRCANGQACAETNGHAACQPWVCAPGKARCGADGAAVETCADDGLSVVKQEPCALGERCIAGRCATLGCEPNAAFCRDGASYVCSFDGTESALTRACDATERCDEATGKCVLKRCEPGAQVCLERDVGTCRNDGSGYDYAPCAVDQACVGGQCQDLTCPPLSRFCDGAAVHVCNATGTASSLESTCSTGCKTSGATAYCRSTTCQPGAALCDGSRATVCAQDGSGPEANGVDCAAVDAYCEQGVCRPFACTPNARSCQGEYMFQCSSDGKALTQYSSYACDSYYWNYSHCNPTTGTCQTQACTPNSKYCSNGVAYACDATGYVASAGENCTAGGKACSQGACVAKSCTEGTYFCKEGNPHLCTDGSNSTQQNTCSANQYCLPGYYYCQPDVCTAGKAVCNGNAVSTCASDGSGPVGVGTACGANKTCVDGACAAIACTAHALVCLNGHVQQCNASGTAASLYRYCVNETYCDSLTGTCKPDVCPAGKAYCDAETLKTCKSDGSGSVDAGTVCSATSKACTPTGCVATALEPLGTSATLQTTSTPSDYILGDVIKVTQRRKLTKMEMSLGVSGGPLAAHWIIYSSTDGVTFYQVLDTPTSIANTAEAWVSSAALDVTLESGLYYLLGLELIPAGATLTYHTDTLSTPSLSFAQVTGSVGRLVTGAPASFKPNPTSSLLYYMRLSTTLP